MPRNKAYEVEVGIFVTVGVSIFALFIIVLVGIGLLGAQDEYRVQFTDIAGLENGSIVRLGGLKVGRVESVGIASDRPDLMEAIIRIKRGTPIRKDSVASITSVGVTGSMFLSISLGTPKAPVLKPGDVITGREAASFQDVINVAKEVGDKANRIISDVGDTIKDVSGDARDLMKGIKGRIQRVLETTDRVLIRVENILSAENEQRITRFLDSVARVSDTLDKNIEPIIKDFRLTLARGRQSLGRIDKAVDSYGKLAENADDFVSKVKERLAAVDRILLKAERVGESLEKVLAKGDDAVADAREMLKNIKGEVPKVLKSTDRVLTKAERFLSKENEERVGRALESIAQVSESLNQNVAPTIKDIRLTLGRARKSLGQVDKTLVSYGKLAENADDFVSKVKRRLAAVDRILLRAERIGEGLEKMVAKGGDVVEDAGQVLSEEIRALRLDVKEEFQKAGVVLRKELGGVGTQARKSIVAVQEDLSGALKSVQSAAQQVNEILKGNRKDLRVIIKNFRSTSQRINEFLIQLQGESGDKKFDTAANNLRLALKRAHSLMSQLDDTVSSNREDIQLLILDLRDTASNLNQFTTTLRERPSSIIFKPPVRPREIQ